MAQGNMKWIAEQVLEGKSLLNIDFGETGLNSDQKLALIDLALKQFPSLPSKPESGAASAQGLDRTPFASSAPGIARLIIQPPALKQDLFPPLESKAGPDPGGSLRRALRVSLRARRAIQGNRPGAAEALRRGWKISLALALRQA
jgi:hypothetical protein